MVDVPAPAIPARALFAEHAADWLAAASRRRSRRALDHTPTAPEKLERLGRFCDTWRPYRDARVVLVRKPTVDVFTGVLGAYGKVTGAPHLFVFLGDQRCDFTDQHVGYAGEAAVLEATALGLATCWVAGFFSAKKVASVVDIAPGERVYAVSPVGQAVPYATLSERAMRGLAGAHHRKRVAVIAPGVDSGAWPSWAVAAAETARVAPSAMNRQPWRLRFEDGALILAKDGPIETPKVTKRLDIGIAMLHVELAAEAHGIVGRWTDLTGSDVARFDPEAAE